MIKDAFGRPFPLESMLGCVGKGWAPLIRELYEVCDANGVVVEQVKEKLGSLRFYVGYASAEVHAKIEAAEARSLVVCEGCGLEGSLRGGMWLKVLCDRCFLCQ